MTQFYTYLLKWSSLQRYYYGVRYANNAHPSDLFVTYFTSSKHVKAFITEHGLPDVIQVRKTFTTKESARNWENRVLRRMDVLHDPRSLNMTNNYAFRSENRTPEHQAKLRAALKGRKSPFKGKTHTPEIRQQISKNRKGQKTSRIYTPLSEETKKKISKANTGKSPPPTYGMLGKKFTEEQKDKMREYSWYNNGTISKKLKPEQLESYPGFVKGRLVGLRSHKPAISS